MRFVSIRRTKFSTIHSYIHKVKSTLIRDVRLTSAEKSFYNEDIFVFILLRRAPLVPLSYCASFNATMLIIICCLNLCILIVHLIYLTAEAFFKKTDFCLRQF